MLTIQPKHYPELLKNVKATLRHGGGSRASVYCIEWQGQFLVLKDYHPCGGFFRRFVAPVLIRREAKKLQQLAHVSCVPNWLANWKNVLVMEYKEAKNPLDVTFNEAQWQFFEEQLYQAINDMHKAGVAHADLRSPGNVIVTPDFQPIIIDFVASLSKPNSLSWPITKLYEKVCAIDKSAVLKIKKMVIPSALTDQEWYLFNQAKGSGKWFRSIIDNGRQWFQK